MAETYEYRFDASELLAALTYARYQHPALRRLVTRLLEALESDLEKCHYEYSPVVEVALNNLHSELKMIQEKEQEENELEEVPKVIPPREPSDLDEEDDMKEVPKEEKLLTDIRLDVMEEDDNADDS